jgi:quinol monooxygenase YgiN
MSQMQVVVHYTVPDQHRLRVVQLLEDVKALTQTQEPENLSFEIYRDVDDEGRLVALERYASREALEAHRGMLYYRNMVVDLIAPLLDDTTVEEFEIPAA